MDLQLTSQNKQISEEMEKVEMLSLLFLSVSVFILTNVNRC